MTAEAIAVKALREYLLRALPARVTARNTANVAQLVAAKAGPYTVPSSATLTVAASRGGAGTAVALTSGSRTAAQIATEVTTAAPSGLTASADDEGRLVLTATAAPTLGATVAADTPSVVAVLAGATANPVFGWDAGGESVVTSPLRAPNHKHLRDGWPSRAPDGAAGAFYVILGERQTTLVSDARQQRDEYLVEMVADVFVPSGTADERTRERITNAVQCIREVVASTEGRSLGAAADGVLLCRLVRTRIVGMPFSFETRGQPSPSQLFDAATLTFSVRVFVAPIS